MEITHQTLVDEEGRPAAAVIPWELFQVIKAEFQRPDDSPISSEWKEELDRRMDQYRKGEARLISSEEVFREVRDLCGNPPDEVPEK